MLEHSHSNVCGRTDKSIQFPRIIELHCIPSSLEQEPSSAGPQAMHWKANARAEWTEKLATDRRAPLVNPAGVPKFAQFVPRVPLQTRSHKMASRPRPTEGWQHAERCLVRASALRSASALVPLQTKAGRTSYKGSSPPRGLARFLQVSGELVDDQPCSDCFVLFDLFQDDLNGHCHHGAEAVSEELPGVYTHHGRLSGLPTLW